MPTPRFTTKELRQLHDLARPWAKIVSRRAFGDDGPGLDERAYSPEEHAALGDGIPALGETTFDVYLNDTAYWRNVPARVWAYTLGGYQVLKKWLSYREKALLGRGLMIDEVDHVRDVARRVSAIRLLGAALDANYAAVKADLYPWPVKAE